MISIPVMTDQSVVRRYPTAPSHPSAAATTTSDASEYYADVSSTIDGAESAAGGAVHYSHNCVSGNGGVASIAVPPTSAAAVLSQPSPVAFVLQEVPAAYVSLALPCSNSILNVGPAPAAIAAPVDVAPPEMPPLAQYCALALQYRCERSQNQDQNIRSCFHSSRIPSISLWDYVRRFAKYSICSEECFIVALIIMDRYVQATNVPITMRNVHRLYITAMTLSVKLRDDSYYSNAYYASIGGVVNGELNVLELELLDTMQWFTWVERAEYDAYLQLLSLLFDTAMP